MPNETAPDNTQREFSGIVVPWLKYIYQWWVEPFVEKHSLNILPEFWMWLTIGICAIIFRVGVSTWGIAVPFIIAALVIIAPNNRYIRRKVFPRSGEVILEALKKINSMELSTVIDFCKRYQFNSLEIIKVLKSRHADKPDLHRTLQKNQDITTEVIEHLAKVAAPEFLSGYLHVCTEQISKSTGQQIIEREKSLEKDVRLNRFSSDRSAIIRWGGKIRRNLNKSYNQGTAKIVMVCIAAILSILLIATLLTSKVIRLKAGVEGMLEFTSIFVVMALLITLLEVIIFSLTGGLMREILLCVADKKK